MSNGPSEKRFKMIMRREYKENRDYWRRTLVEDTKGLNEAKNTSFSGFIKIRIYS